MAQLIMALCVFDQINLVLALLQQTCVYLVIAYLISRSRIFIPLTRVTFRPTYRLACIVVFSLFCVMGSYLGFRVVDSIANTRAIGAVLGGILGGPVVGLVVGFVGGIHRYSLGGVSATACMISTICEGFIGGLVHVYFVNKKRNDKLLSPVCVGITTFVGEIVQMLIILTMVTPHEAALAIIQKVGLPMFMANTCGAALFIHILNERRTLYETQTGSFSSTALKIATRTEGLLRNGLTREDAAILADILLQETKVAAVAIADHENIIAFAGIGADHHKAGLPVSSPQTRKAIDDDVIVYADGNEIPFRCSISDNCPLGISMIVPLHGANEKVIGAIKLYDLKTRLLPSISRAMGEGIGRLLSTQILVSQYEAQRDLLSQSQIRLLHAQVNPHFLFNTLNTLSAIIRKDPEKARDLVQNLSTFFRKNLKRPSEIATLGDELDHTNAYLQIELARFQDKLSIETDIPEDLRVALLPAFSLQPLVENAVKHGTSQILEKGEIKISAQRIGNELILAVEDNAGLIQPTEMKNGLGINLVDQRIKNMFGSAYGVFVNCTPDVVTRVKIRVPFESAPK